MTDNRVCVVCQRREVERSQVCGPCRLRIDSLLEEIPELITTATTLTLPAPRPTWEWRLVGADLGCANRIRIWIHSLASGPTGTPGRVRVAGTRTAPLPVSLALLDLVGPGSPHVTDTHHDQEGDLPPDVWMLQWATDWAEQLDHYRPPRTVSALVTWLRNRLNWACDDHPAVDEFAAELRAQVGRLRALAGILRARPELCEGVACQHCDTRALWRIEGRVECGECGRIYTTEEYVTWVRELAQQTRKAAA